MDHIYLNSIDDYGELIRAGLHKSDTSAFRQTFPLSLFSDSLPRFWTGELNSHASSCTQSNNTSAPLRHGGFFRIDGMWSYAHCHGVSHAYRDKTTLNLLTDYPFCHRSCDERFQFVLNTGPISVQSPNDALKFYHDVSHQDVRVGAELRCSHPYRYMGALFPICARNVPKCLYRIAHRHSNQFSGNWSSKNGSKLKDL